MKNRILTFTIVFGILFDQLSITILTRHYSNWITTPEYERWFSLVDFPLSFLLALVCLLVLVRNQRLREQPVGIGLVTAGLLSNTLTFLRFGYVIDYLPLPTTYINLADLIIVVGCLLLAYQLMYTKNPGH